VGIAIRSAATGQLTGFIKGGNGCFAREYNKL